MEDHPKGILWNLYNYGWMNVVGACNLAFGYDATFNLP